VIIEILFIMDMFLLGLTMWPSGPAAPYPWAPWVLVFIALLLLGLHDFAGGVMSR
jgi:hypothetical protein